MQRHFHEELDDLKGQLLKMALLVRDAIEKAIRALLDQDLDLAQSVIQQDRVINDLEITIDEISHNLLTLKQPVAVDMRLLTMILKINNDLERIGDHAVNIAEKVPLIRKEGVVSDLCPVTNLCPVQKMSELATQVLVEAVDCFLKGDAVQARALLKKDDEIDELYDAAYFELETRMQEDTSIIPTCLALLTISHDIERIGDLANNIAEDVIYVAQGKEVRHHRIEEEPFPRASSS